MSGLTRTRAALEEIGFHQLGTWEAQPDRLTYVLADDSDETLAKLDAQNALYAFCQGDEVLYVGKTTRSIRVRFGGYCRPSKTQATNLRCHAKIRDALGRGEDISILAFAPSAQLQYGSFRINLAAGLEDALIAHFVPPWNGGGPGRRIVTETAAIEAEETAAPDPEEDAQPNVSFEVELGQTYYAGDIINPGKAMAHYFGDDGEPVRVFFSDGSPTVIKKIDRRNAGPDNVRLRGSAAETGAWIRKHFRQGERLKVKIRGPNVIEMIAPQS